MAGDLATFVAQTSAAKQAAGELAQVIAKVTAAQEAEAAAAAQAAAAQSALAASGATVAAALRSVAEASARDAQASELAKAANISLSQAQKVLADQAKMAAAAQKEVAAAAQKARDATDAARAPVREIGDSLLRWGTGATEAGGAVGKVQGLLKNFGPQGQAVAAALGILIIGITTLFGAIESGMSKAIESSNKAAQKLAVFASLTGSSEAGKSTLSMLSKLSERLPYSSGQLSEWAQSMIRAGYSGKGLESAVKAIAAAEALHPESGSSAAQEALSKLSGGGQEAAQFLKQVQGEAGKGEKSLRAMGLTMTDLGGKTAVAKMTAGQLSDAIQKALVKKGAGPLEAMMNTWPVILDKAKSGFMSLFGGLGKSVEPFMASVRSLFSMFNKGSPTMAALRGVITSVFSTLFSWATKATDIVHSAFQQIVIAALKVRIGINPIIVALGQLRAEVVKAIAATGLFQGKSTALATVLAFVGQAVRGAFTFAVYVIVGFVRALTFMVGIATTVITKVRSLFASFSLPNLAAAAGNMISSFVTGITSKIGSVIGAMMGMGQAAKKALFGALGIASPSKVALEAAGNVTSTFADRVDDGKAETSAAFSGMVKVPEAGRSKGGGGGGAADRIAEALDRLATAVEMSPGMRETVQLLMNEAMQEAGLA